MKNIFNYICVTLFLLCLPGCSKNGLNSAEVDVFMKLNFSLKENNMVLNYINNESIEKLEERASSFIHFKPVVEVVNKSRKASENFLRFMDDLNEEIIEVSGGCYSKKEAVESEKPFLNGYPKGVCNTKIPRQILWEGEDPQADSIDHKLMELKKYYLLLFNGLWDNNEIKNSSFSDIAKRDSLLGELEGILTASCTDNIKESGIVPDNLSVAAIMALFRKIQNDILRSEAAFMAFINKQIDKESKNHKYLMLDMPQRSLIKKGTSYNSEIRLVKYVNPQEGDLSVSVNGKQLPIFEGQAYYECKPGSTGTKKFTAELSIRNILTGKLETLKTDFKYEVLHNE